MISTDIGEDIELALRRQVSKLKEADTNKVREKPLQDLGKLLLIATGGETTSRYDLPTE